MSRNKYPEETEKLILDAAEKLFLERGYERTSINDIIRGLGGLSKGAVYHHFHCKEDIFNAVGERFNGQVIEGFRQIRDGKHMTGAEKLKKMFSLSMSSSERDVICSICPNMLENPKLLSLQVSEVFQEIAPNYVQPIIEEGIRDGSIHTEYPKELAEVMILLSNVWLNPAVVPADTATMKRRVYFYADIMKSLGMDLLDQQMLEGFERYCELYKE